MLRASCWVIVEAPWTFEPAPMFPTSAVFRAGLASFTKIFADEYAAKNIRINNVLPGIVATEAQEAHVRGLVGNGVALGYPQWPVQSGSANCGAAEMLAGAGENAVIWASAVR